MIAASTRGAIKGEVDINQTALGVDAGWFYQRASTLSRTKQGSASF